MSARVRATGRLCLDLVATRGPGAVDGPHDDALASVGALRAWIADLPPVVGRLDLDAAALGRVLCLRHAMTLVLDHVLDRRASDNGAGLPVPPPAGNRDRSTRLRRAVDTLNELAVRSPPVLVLDAVLDTVDDGTDLVLRPPLRTDVAALLALLAWDLLDLLADTDARGRLRRCAAPDCRRVFLGDRLGRPRRWCSSTGCGARTRVAAYRARRARG